MHNALKKTTASKMLVKIAKHCQKCNSNSKIGISIDYIE